VLHWCSVFRESIAGRSNLKLAVLLTKALLVLGLLVVFVFGIRGCMIGSVRQEQSRALAWFCIDNQRDLARAAQMYARDCGGRLPPAQEWCDLLRPYLKDAKAFVCPATRNQRCSYAFNASLSQVRLASIREPGGVVLFFESDRGWNAAGGPELLPAQPRHQGARIDGWAFADGHVKGGTRDLAKAPEHWQPQPQAAGKGSR